MTVLNNRLEGQLPGDDSLPVPSAYSYCSHHSLHPGMPVITKTMFLIDRLQEV